MERRVWTIKELLAVATDYLHNKGIEAPRLASDVLLAHVLNVERITLYLEFDRPLTAQEVSRFRELIKRRAAHEPLQYITGKQEFWSLQFEVNPDVLIPRPETELLVDIAVKLCKQFQSNGIEEPKVLDLCTGCGAVAVSIAKEVPEARLWATDLSSKALSVAKRNARCHGVNDRITFICGDLFAPLRDKGLRFHAIVTNPPYVAQEELDELPLEVKDYEPRSALDGGPGGMSFIEDIIREGPDFLAPSGQIMIEMDPRQVARARDLISTVPGYGNSKVIKDYSGAERIIVGGGA